jgi:hypothetical protein
VLPQRRKTDLLADESAPSAAAARGLHKDRRRLMTAESRLLSMHDAVDRAVLRIAAEGEGSAAVERTEAR